MRNSSMLLAAIESGDWSDTTMKAALDALTEDLGLPMHRAVTMISRFMVDARHAAIHKMRWNLSKDDGKATPLLYRVVNAAVGFDLDARPFVKVVIGYGPPQLMLPRFIGRRKLVDENTIEVGAAWLIDRLELSPPIKGVEVD